MWKASYSLFKARISWVLFLVLLLVIGGYTYGYKNLPSSPTQSDAAPSSFEWPRSGEPQTSEWSVFNSLKENVSGATSPLAQRLRLAGTFFAFSEGGTENTADCKAILDDLVKKEQYLVKEGDVLDDMQIVRIFRDHLIIRTQGREEELWLSFASLLQQKGGVAGGPSSLRPGEEPQPLEVTRFGKRVGEARWVFSRDSLMSYYKELLDDPERIAALFVSLKPDYQEKAVAGYNVDVQGEKDFFSAVGLQQGDTVRKVNSMRMISQARAEYFISEFVKNRLSAVVLDIERNGQPKKLIYLIR